MTDSTIGESTKGTYGEFANQEIKKENLKENFKENHDRWMTKIYSVILNQANGNYCTYLSVSNLLNTFIGSYVR